MNSLRKFAIAIAALACASRMFASAFHLQALSFPQLGFRMKYRITLVSPFVSQFVSHFAALLSSLSRFYPASHRVDLGVA